jgi:hypothetical protein
MSVRALCSQSFLSMELPLCSQSFLSMELLAVEWDDHAVETFKLNFPGVPVWHGDIAGLSVE